MRTRIKTYTHKCLRANPILENVVQDCTNYNLSELDYAFIEKPPKTLNLKNSYGLKSNIFGGGQNDQDDDMPYLIVFVVGGISYNEICHLEALRINKKLNHKLIIGSTNLLTAKEYIRNLSDLKSPESDIKSVDLKSIELKIV